MKTFRLYVLLSLFILIASFSYPYAAHAEKRVPILVYHSIAPYKGHGQKQLYVTPENFKQQMTYLKDHGYTLLTFEDWDKIGQVQKPIFITLDDGYKDNENVWSIFKELKDPDFQPKATIFVISDFIGRTNRLNKEELKQMAHSGYFSVQSHTATHPDLTKVQDLEYEIGKSKEKIEKITEKPVIALAYPYGEYNLKVINIAKTYYKFGITTIPMFYTRQGRLNENYLIPRIYVKNSTTPKQFAHVILKE